MRCRVVNCAFQCLSVCQAHSCVEKAGMISLVKIRELDIDDDFSLRGWTLQKAIDVSTKILYQNKLLEKRRAPSQGHSTCAEHTKEKLYTK